MEYPPGVRIIHRNDGKVNICIKRVGPMKRMLPYERRDVIHPHGIQMNKLVNVLDWEMSRNMRVDPPKNVEMHVVRIPSVELGNGHKNWVVFILRICMDVRVMGIRFGLSLLWGGGNFWKVESIRMVRGILG